MKKHPDTTVALILRDMLHADSEASGLGQPGTPEENAEAAAGLKRAIASGTIVFHCVGCGEGTAAMDAEVCECGGFVCPACRKLEEDGVCAHEPLDLDSDDE